MSIKLIVLCRAEEDADYARRMMEEDQIKVQANKMAIELTDEVTSTSVLS